MKYLMIVLLAVTWQFSNAQTQWVKSPGNLVMTKSIDLYEGAAIGAPAVIDEGDTMKMLYAGGGTDTKGRICYAFSLDGISWTKYNNDTPVLDVSSPGHWDSHFLDTPWWLKDSSGYKMYYFGDTDNYSPGGCIGLAISTDGRHWTRGDTVPVLSIGAPGDWDGLFIESPTVVFDGSSYMMWYSAADTTWQVKIGAATSPDGIHWTKYSGNPVITGGSIYSWEGFGVTTPTVLMRNGKYEMWYCGVSYYDFIAHNQIDTIKIGYATSTDGLHWTKYAQNPIMNTYDPPYTIQDTNGPWAPSTIYRPAEGKYYMWYETGYGFGLATAIDNTLGIGEVTDNRKFTLSPNPSTGKVTIHIENNEGSKRRVQVYDVCGSLMQEVPLLQSAQIDISSLANGLYFIQMKDEPNYKAKLIKQ